MKHTFTTLISCLVMIAGLLSYSGTCAWAQVVSGETYNTTSTSNLPSGWSGSGSGSSYIQLTESSNYIQTSEFSQNGFTSIILKARKYGGPSNAQALITVSWYSNDTETVLGTVAPTSTSLTNYTISSPNNPTGNTSGYVKIQCKGASSGKGSGVSQVKITYTSAGGGTPTCETPTFSPAAGTYTSSQNVTISTSTQDATIYYTTNGDTPTTSSSVYSDAIPVSTTTTIKAIATKDGNNDSDVASATYTIVQLQHAGTQEDPYTVADARTAIDAGVGITNVYATGIVSEIVTAYNSQYGNISYNISYDGETTSDQLQAYRGKSYNGNNFTSADDIQIGDVVVVYGSLKKYNSTYEFDQDNQLVSLDRPVVPTIVASLTTLSGFTYQEGFGPSNVKYFTVSGDNLTDNISLSLASSDFEISLSENSGYSNNISLTPSEGTVSSTIYVRLRAGLAQNDYDDTITVSSDGASNQSIALTGSVSEPPTFASLPFSYDNGISNIASTDGLYQEGLGTDYNSSPKLKFDNTGDYVILQFSERPGVLTFDIKGNGFSGGTFKVQASEDGTSYSDIVSYTSLGDKSSETIDDLAEGVRYIKWIYTNKSNGNVALGNIKLNKYVEPVPTIIIDPDSVDATYSEKEGTLYISFSHLSISDAKDFEIQYYNANEEEITEPDWITTDISDLSGLGDYIISYVIDENSSIARSTYFKVFALGDQDYVYSNLVTINQESAQLNLSYATLPFSFDRGKSSIENTDGLTHSGLGSDYANAPLLKFDTTGDNLVLTINQAPGTLSFDIKGYGFSGGTFKVQYSVNGEDYIDLKKYTSLDETSNEEFSNLPSNVRYIKWIYTEKSSGNVALGNISLTSPASNPNSIDITGTLDKGYYWATFYNGTARYSLPEGAKAFTMKSENKQLYILGANGREIPKDTAVIIMSETADITLTKSDDATAVSINGDGNILKGSDNPVAKVSISGKPYVLGVVGGVMGFYEFTGSGIPAGKAYYVVNE